MVININVRKNKSSHNWYLWFIKIFNFIYFCINNFNNKLVIQRNTNEIRVQDNQFKIESKINHKKYIKSFIELV